MKKTWEEPKIMVQKFVANEYVAACGASGTVYNFVCDAGEKNKHYAVKDANGNVATISGMYMDGGGSFWGLIIILVEKRIKQNLILDS